MFTKKDSPAPQEFAAAPAPTKRSVMKSRAPSILSSDLTIHGSIISEGEVQLDGTVEGDVKAVSLTIGEEATVRGEIVAETVVVRGRVEGSVRARQVQLASTARVEGDVVHASLAIESGAYFDGQCKRSSDPLGEKSGAAKPAAAAGAPKPAAAAPGAPSTPPSPPVAEQLKSADPFLSKP